MTFLITQLLLIVGAIGVIKAIHQAGRRKGAADERIIQEDIQLLEEAEKK